MSKITPRRIRCRRNLLKDVYSEDEEDTALTKGVELSDLSESEEGSLDSENDESEELSQSEAEEGENTNVAVLDETNSGESSSNLEKKEEKIIVNNGNTNVEESSTKGLSSDEREIRNNHVSSADNEIVNKNETVTVKEESTNAKESPELPPKTNDSELAYTKENTQRIHKENEQDLSGNNSADEQKIYVHPKVEKRPSIQRSTTSSSISSSDTDQPKTQSDGEKEKLTEVAGTADDNTTNTGKIQEHQEQNQKPLTAWQKKVLARQEYRKKLVEDPAFVPHLGEFWGHDDRYMDDGLRNDFDKRRKKPPLPFSQQWDHDGFEELMRLEDDEERKRRERYNHQRGRTNN
ncbi:2345_t:CDS:2, partial [Ambispora leptoticha]